MKMPRHLDKLSTGAGLLVLAVGFVSLGFLSFMNRHSNDAANGLFVEETYSIVGSLISILVGAIFLTIAVLFTATLRRRNRSLGRKPQVWLNTTPTALDAERSLKRAEISVDATRVEDVLGQVDCGACI